MSSPKTQLFAPQWSQKRRKLHEGDTPKEAKEEAEKEEETLRRNPRNFGLSYGVHSFGKEELRSINDVIRHRGGSSFAEGVGRQSSRRHLSVARDATEQQPTASPRTLTGTVILETGDDSLAENTKSGGINAADVLCKQVLPLLLYLHGKLKKYAGPSNVGSYVELVCNRMQMKVAIATITAD
ncbi:hypothetical protein AXG93_3828s1010 [Marchantia polymorpha subsp. ruderalis]|uniref:Uncharacterized protein n=1 Tax=Marchantia polymorpha subsp. ruderalis TaxID=1480154 RepID=A0A176VGU8_MARPO|nr:hypothetical protein AXG93_3828s1010 [Marchantia polymorpha subsp. ruderalis]